MQTIIQTTSALLNHQVDPPFNFIPISKAGTKTHLPNTSASVEPLSATLLPPYNDRCHSAN
jgi:hypothetical protein